MKAIARECRLNGIKVYYTVADAPKRSELRCVKNHNSFYGCDSCLVRATDGKKTYPSSKIGERRTKRWLELQLEDPDAMKLYGIHDRSPMFDFEDFDVIDGMLPEYMHS